VTLLGQGAAQGLRLVSNIILSRLLFPEAFGLMAIVRMLMTGLEMVSNVGVRPAIVRHARGDAPAFLNTAWLIQILRGTLLWLVGVGLAIPLARFYEEPQLNGLVPVAVLTALLAGFTSTKMVTLTRHITLTRGVVIDLVAQAIALLAMIAVSLAYRSVWALVVGALVASSVRVALSHLAIPGPSNRVQWEPEAAREIFSFGKWILVSTLFGFIALRADIMIVGKLVPMDVLGVYSIGITISSVPRVVLSRITQSVLLPVLSASYREGHDSLVSDYRTSRRLVLPAGMVTLLGVVVVAPAFFAFLYDDRYHEAGWIAQLAMLTLWFTFMQDTAGRALMALGDSRAFAMGSTTKAIATALGCIAGYQISGHLSGLMIGASVGALCGYLTIVFHLVSNGVRSLTSDLVCTLLGLILGLGCALAPYFVFVDPNAFQLAVVTLAAGAVVLTPCVLFVGLQVRSRMPRRSG
jgi:O-antigen/teichoic acid export membrane protein